MTTVADRIVRRLREAGVSHVFGMPGGGSNLDLIDAARRAGLPFVLTATETGGAIAAAAQAEIARMPAACLTTLGPGAASVVNGVASALLDRAPLVVFTDSHPSSASACTHQRLDHRALLAPVTKWSATLTSGQAEQTVADALARAVASPPGPVHLDCPGEVLSAESPTSTVQSPAPCDRQRSTLEFDVSSSRRPLLIVGLGARRPEDAAAIRGLCERRGVPALVTYKAKGVVPDSHPWFGGVFTNAALERPLVEEADLLIGVGLDPVELIPRPWTYTAPIISCARSAMDDRHVPFAAQAIGDVAGTVSQLAELLDDSTWDPLAIRTAVAAQSRRAFGARAGFSADRVVAAAADRLAGTARVTVDAGAHMFPATIAWPVSDANDLLISNGLSTMGFALPAAIGAALVDRARPVVALTGDGGLMMCVAELATAVRERLQIIVIVFADATLSLIDIKQQRRQLPADGVALGPIGWAKIAEGFGAAAFAASSEAELSRAIDGALAHRGPSLIEARIDASNYGRMLEAVRG